MAQISFIHDDSKLGGSTVVVTKDNVDFLGMLQKCSCNSCVVQAIPMSSK